MRRQAREESTAGLGYFIAGAFVGAVAAFLLAPESGAELLDTIKRLLHVRINGAHAVDGLTGERRHGRRV